MTVYRPHFAEILTALAALGSVAAPIWADEEQVLRRRQQLLAEMRSLAEQVSVKSVNEESQIELIQQPVFRYDDQPRRFIDATMWVWTESGRPIACQKIEARLHQDTGEPEWGYCFTSLAEKKLAVEWSLDRKYRSTEPGVKFEPVPDAPIPGPRSSDRRRQAREMARGFSGRILLNPKTNASAEMRLLTTPIYEFSDPQSQLLAGAIFGFETNGTNPDLLVVLEVRGSPEKPQWHFAPARMTTGGITLNYRDEKVWEAPFVSPNDGPFANWLFFRTPRTPAADEKAPES